jgi:hypothetical protein
MRPLAHVLRLVLVCFVCTAAAFMGEWDLSALQEVLVTPPLSESAITKVFSGKTSGEEDAMKVTLRIILMAVRSLETVNAKQAAAMRH